MPNEPEAPVRSGERENPVPLKVFLLNEGIPLSMTGENRSGLAEPFALEDDRTLRSYALQVGRNSARRELIALYEDDGTPTSSIYGKDSGGNLDAIRTNASQQLQIEVVAPSIVIGTLQGADEASNADTLRTDPDRILWTRPRTAYTVVISDSLTATANFALWTPGGTSAEVYEVEFYVNSVDTAVGRWFTIGNDVGAGGGLAVAEYWAYQEVVPWPGNSGWRGPFLVSGDDVVRGSCEFLNALTIHFRIKRVDTGA